MISVLIALTGLAHAAGPSHHLVITGLQFPKTEVVKTGDTITWKNDDLVPHTVTAEDGTFHSPTIEAGQEWTYKFTSKKSTGYKCDFHPDMHSKIVVKK